MDGSTGGGGPKTPSEESKACGELAGEAGIVERKCSPPERRFCTTEQPPQVYTPEVDRIEQR